MSKAFTSESDNDDDAVIQVQPLPPGTRNYITPAGAKKLEDERQQMLSELALLSDDLDGQRKRRSVERRLEFLKDHIDAAQIVDPASQPSDHIRFGATVTVRDSQGQDQKWRIVGLDEVDLEKGAISWMSPLATALLEKRVGQFLFFGNQRLTVTKIEYIL